MTLETENDRSVKRRLILRDALTFLSLAMITAVLFAITSFLFHSFATHRAELAQRWAARGQAAIASGHPDQAIVALRTALSYAPGERSYELLLAQALDDAGHTEEAYNYFLGYGRLSPVTALSIFVSRASLRRRTICRSQSTTIAQRSTAPGRETESFAGATSVSNWRVT